MRKRQNKFSIYFAEDKESYFNVSNSLDYWYWY